MDAKVRFIRRDNYYVMFEITKFKVLVPIMNRRKFLKWAGFGALSLSLYGCIKGLNATQQNHYYSGPITDHFDGVHFFNRKDKHVQAFLTF